MKIHSAKFAGVAMVIALTFGCAPPSPTTVDLSTDAAPAAETSSNVTESVGADLPTEAPAAEAPATEEPAAEAPATEAPAAEAPATEAPAAEAPATEAPAAEAPAAEAPAPATP
jgi:hypothetical protein